LGRIYSGNLRGGIVKITEHFSSEEFTCKCGCGYDAINPYLVHRLQVIRDIAGLPITILSGCRCRAHNNRVGGAESSYHLEGEACDWTFGGVEGSFEHSIMIEICERKLVRWSGGFHYYRDKNFCHIDIGEKRRWK
jgi:uncharacterized protein YcbK (DUF882 family)